jgi:hypothetical protein
VPHPTNPTHQSPPFPKKRCSGCPFREGERPGLDPTNENPLKNSLDSCQIFKFAKIAHQYFLLCSYETVLKNISKLVISLPSQNITYIIFLSLRTKMVGVKFSDFF